MEEKKTVFTYIGQVFASYGVMVVIFMIFSALIGERTGDYSSLFCLGRDGLTLATLSQLLLLALIITVARILFLSDACIKNMQLFVRNLLFFLTVMIALVLFVILFGWFPVNDLFAWLGFFVCYTISMLISVMIIRLKEKSENRKMQDALDQYRRS
ncbi:MAG: DUF3021 family protein [Lachnospiraceae bacterium]|nr:DUF3021 family protein [Lachnospiraceae bacterium]